MSDAEKLAAIKEALSRFENDGEHPIAALDAICSIIDRND